MKEEAGTYNLTKYYKRRVEIKNCFLPFLEIPALCYSLPLFSVKGRREVVNN